LLDVAFDFEFMSRDALSRVADSKQVGR
jgi:hypothetical protein